MRTIRSFRALVASTFALAATAGPANAGKYVVPCTADSWLRAANPTQNNGTQKQLTIRQMSANEGRAVLGFDFTALPVSTSITSAVLELFVTDEDADGTVTVHVHEMTSAWSEKTVTWASHATAFDSTSWGSFAPAAQGSLQVDVTPLVRAWVDSSKTNRGMMLIAQGGSDQIKLSSREASSTNERPVLTVNTGGPQLVSADLDVALSVTSSAPDEGDSLTYTVALTNLGPNAAGAIEVRDVLPAGVTYASQSATQGTYTLGTGVWDAGGLLAAGYARLDLDVVVDPGTAGQTITNGASIKSTDQPDFVVGNDADSVSIFVGGADLFLTKVVSDSTPDPNQTVTFTVTLQNAGPNDATGVKVTDALPADLIYQASGTSQGTYVDSTGIWSVGTVVPGATPFLSIDARVADEPATDYLANVATISAADQGDPVAGNGTDLAAVNVNGNDLQLSVGVDQAAPAEGDSVVFQISLTNAGGGTTSGIQVVDSLPAGLTYAADSTGLGVFDSGTGDWNVGALGAGGSATLFLTTVVDPGTAGTAIANGAQISQAGRPDPVAANDADSVTVTVRSADVGVTVGVDNSSPSVGSTVTYTVRVFNAGPDSALGVAALDSLPSDLTYVSDTPDQGAYDSGTGVWAVGTIAPADTATLLLSASVDGDTAGHTIWNVASVLASSPTDTNTANDADSVSLTVDSEGVQVIGTQSTSGVLPGQTGAHLFTLMLANSHTFATTLQQITFRNTTAGPGSVSQLDAELGTVTLYQDDGDFAFKPMADFPLGQAIAQGGNLVFNGSLSTLSSGSLVMFFLGVDPAVTARDGDVIDVDIQSAGDVVFSPPVTKLNAWPVAPAGSLTVDGMAAAQVGMNAFPGTLPSAGAQDVLVLDAVLPPNGYVADTLQEIEVGNVGTAGWGTDIAAIAAWADGGDGTFDAGAADDVLLGSPTRLAAAGGALSWRLTGLSMPIPAPGGQRIFAGVDLAATATPGNTLLFEIPSGTGLVVVSDNDGPTDGSARSPSSQTVQAPPPTLDVTSSQTGATLLPGEAARQILRVKIVNPEAAAETLEAITFTNATSGPGSQADLDAEWTSFQLLIDNHIGIFGGGTPVGVGNGKSAKSFSAGRVTFGNLSVKIRGTDSVTVILKAAPSLTARDGDVLDVQVVDASDIVLADSTVQLNGTWPLDPPDTFPVDGMSAAQIATNGARLSNSILTGSARNLSLVMTVPPNGYEPDTLRYVNLRNAAPTNPAQGGTDIARMELWYDHDGDGVPEPTADDASGLLGVMVDTGNRWEITGLAHPLPAGGSLLFVTTDVADQATVPSSVQLSLPTAPDFGLGVESGNDGPIDMEVSSGVVQTVSQSDRITLSTNTIAPGTVRPETGEVSILQLAITNDYSVAKTLTALSVTNRTQGTGTLLDLDAEVGQVRLRADSTGGAEVAKAVVFSGGSAAFTVFNSPIVLAAGETRTLVVTSDVSAPAATDGDVIGAELTDETRISFEDATTVVASWPLDSQAQWTIDGMVAAQITNHGAPPATLGPGEGPALALDVTFPGNGYAGDVLQGLAVVNDSSAVAADIAEMRMWRDGGDGAFDATQVDDSDLGALTFNSGAWISPLLTDPVPAGGARYYVTVKSSLSLVDGRTIRLAVPVGGVTMESGNDGPIDVRMENSEILTLSTSALLADIAVVPDKSTLGDSTITATMTVRNVGDSTVVDIVPDPLVPDLPGVLTQIGGPLPDTLALAAGAESAFVWTFRADSSGTVRFTGSAAGREVGTLLTRSTPVTSSNVHDVFLEAQDLEIFPVESMPFSVTQGQTGVVPLSLTLTNMSPPGGSDVRVTRLSFRLEDGAGAGIVPDRLLSRVVVNEGTSVYLDKTVLEPAGDTVDLVLQTPVLVPADSAQVTVSLSLDISDSTTVPDFRLQMPDGSWLDADDATSGAPVTIVLPPGESYPIQSGLARVVAEATELDVAAVAGTDQTVAQGQPAVELLDLDFLNPDPDSLAADVRVSSFAVTLIDTAGATIAQPSLYLQTIRVHAAFQTWTFPVTGGPQIPLALSPLLSVPVNTPVAVGLEGDVDPLSPLGVVRLCLADSTTFDARDANTGASVPAVYASDPVQGPKVTIVAPADTMFVTGRALLPATLPVGTPGQPAMRLVLRHPGGAQSGAIRLDSVTLECRDQAELPLVPASFVDRVQAFRGGAQIGANPDPPTSGNEVTLSLGGSLLEPGETDSVEIRFDAEVTAPASLVKLTVPAGNVVASDVTLSTPVAVSADSAATFPLTSGLTQLQTPARDLIVAFQDEMPPVLVADGSPVVFAALSLSNPAPQTAGTVELDHLVLRAAAGDLASIDLGSAVSSVEAWHDGALWAASGDLATSDDAPTLAPAANLVVPPGATEELELRAVLRAGAAVPSLRLGIEAKDVGVVQPQSQLLSVAVQPAEGGAFPYWTEAGNFAPSSLEESWSNFPNPFAAGRAETRFAFFLPQSGRVTLKLWTARGKAVRTILDSAPLPAGLHQDPSWDGRNGRGDVVINGVYLAEIAVRYDDGTAERHLRKVAVVR